jgi:hypothetical protein
MLRKMDMRFGTWNVRSLYRTGPLMTVAKEISKCKSDLVGVQVSSAGTEGAPNQQANIRFSMERGMRILNDVQVSSFVLLLNQNSNYRFS